MTGCLITRTNRWVLSLLFAPTDDSCQYYLREWTSVVATVREQVSVVTTANASRYAVSIMVAWTGERCRFCSREQVSVVTYVHVNRWALLLLCAWTGERCHICSREQVSVVTSVRVNRRALSLLSEKKCEKGHIQQSLTNCGTSAPEQSDGCEGIRGTTSSNNTQQNLSRPFLQRTHTIRIKRSKINKHKNIETIIWKLHNWLWMSLQPSAQKCGCLSAKDTDLFSIHRLDRFGHIKALLKTGFKWKTDNIRNSRLVKRRLVSNCCTTFTGNDYNETWDESDRIPWAK
jgi:hypothetical protein